MTNTHTPNQTQGDKTQPKSILSYSSHNTNAIKRCKKKITSYQCLLRKPLQTCRKRFVPTWGLSECCRWTGIWPGCLRAGGQGRTCCMETQPRDNTAVGGRGPRSWRKGLRRSWLSGRGPRRCSGGHAGCLLAARGRSRHQGKMGLGQERRDKAKN